LKIVAEKSRTVKAGDDYYRSGYVLEEEGVEPSDAQVTREEMNSMIKSWLAEDFAGLPELVDAKGGGNKGSCAVCGKEIDPKYNMCWRCANK